MCVGKQYSRLYKSYFGGGTVGNFFSNLTSESKFYCRLLERNFNNLLL